ncbi:MAG: hypothetical protein SGPRY_004264 [Prymnesium sp.]
MTSRLYPLNLNPDARVITRAMAASLLLLALQAEALRPALHSAPLHAWPHHTRPLALSPYASLPLAKRMCRRTGGVQMDFVSAAASSILSKPVLRDTGCAVLLAFLAKVWVALWGGLAKAGVLPSTLTRKLIHTGTGPLFIMGWPLFSNAPTAIFAACAVPVVNLASLLFAGRLGLKSEGGEQLVSSLSRTGDAKEVGRGPFYYTLVLLAATALSFRQLPGVIAVCQMAVGDGLADIAGRRFGKTKWGFVESKSVEGSLAFALSAWAASLGMVSGCHLLGYTSYTFSSAALPMLFISVACATVELFSAKFQSVAGDFADDNLTVPLTGALLSMLLLQA